MNKHNLKRREIILKIALLCDYGMDDAVATLHLLKYAHKFEFIDILPIGGNFPLKEVMHNAKRILTYVENLPENIRLVDTSCIPQPFERLTDIHGEDGIGEFLPKQQNYKNKIIDFNDWICNVNDDYIIVSLGPCTVTREILKKQNVNSVIFMCGNISEPPNYNGYEFNHGMDPESFAECVKYPHFCVTLDTCHNKYCDFNLINITEDGLFKKSVDRTVELSNDRLEDACYIYDLVAVIYLLEPEKFTSEVKTDPFGNQINVLKYNQKEFLL